MKKTTIGLIAVAVVIVLAMSGAWYLQDSRKPVAGKPEQITIGISPRIDSTGLIYIADDQHFFADNGLNVTIIEYDTGSAAVDNMLKNGNDIATATEFIIVTNALKQEKICGIGSIAKSDKQYYLIGRNDRGIHNISDLKGKKIGVPLGTVAEFYLGRFLELHGINPGDLTVVDVPPSQSVDAIGNGMVDAILIWRPYTNAIENRLGSNAVEWPAESGQLGYWNAICRNEWAAQHPELIKQFLQSIDQAAKYSVYHPTEAKAIVQKGLRTDDAYIQSAWPDIQYALSLDQSLITAMEDEGRWMINNNLTSEKNVPDFRNYFYLKGIEEVKPDAVNIIR
jgi:NitT/TauT family transport system substrate-binding protein